MPAPVARRRPAGVTTRPRCHRRGATAGCASRGALRLAWITRSSSISTPEPGLGSAGCSRCLDAEVVLVEDVVEQLGAAVVVDAHALLLQHALWATKSTCRQAASATGPSGQCGASATSYASAIAAILWHSVMPPACERSGCRIAMPPCCEHPLELERASTCARRRPAEWTWRRPAAGSIPTVRQAPALRRTAGERAPVALSTAWPSARTRGHGSRCRSSRAVPSASCTAATLATAASIARGRVEHRQLLGAVELERVEPSPASGVACAATMSAGRSPPTQL